MNHDRNSLRRELRQRRREIPAGQRIAAAESLAAQLLALPCMPTEGFVAGYWTRAEDGSNGLSMLVFESEDAARAVAGRIPGSVPDGVTFESAEVREVAANA